MNSKLIRLAAICGLIFIAGIATASAQTGTIKGTVINKKNSKPVIGANVYVKSIQRGAATDKDGNFAIQDVPYGSYKIRITYVGFKTKTLSVTVDQKTVTVDVQLTQNVGQLENVVVTALGGESSKNSLGYSTQEVSSEDLTLNRSTNITNGLSGRIAGANVTSSSGTVGSSTRIVLRGNTSISGDNQPLFIVDGVFIDNSNFNAPGNYSGAADYGNTAMDIDPENIKSINVLKGPSAAALYGSRASNGAIIIETKNGSGLNNGFQVEVNSNTTFKHPFILPDLQDQYGQGLNGKYKYVDGRGGGINDATGRSWGPPLDGRLIPQWWSNGKPVPWIPHPDNTKNFFVTGITSANNASIAGNNGKVNYRVSGTYTHDKGMFENVNSDKANIQANLGTQIGKKFQLNVRSTYINYIARNMPNVGYSYPGNPIEYLYTFHGRQLDMSKLRNYENPDGSPRNFLETFYDNYFWVLHKDTKRQDRNRIIGGLNLKYDFTNWLSANAQVGIDWYQENRNKRIAYGSFTDNDGYYKEDVRHISDKNYNFRLHAKYDITEDFNIDTRIGVSHRDNYYTLNGASTNSLVVPGVYSLTNSAVRPTVQDRTTEKKVNSIFGDLKLGMKNYLFLNLTGRNDWSSTLPRNNDSYFYPSANLSFIFTNALDLGLEWFNLGKIRASWSKVGNDTDPYQLNTYYNSSSAILGNIPSYSISTTLANSDLKPEQTYSWEMGANLKFFSSRLSLDFTYYKSKSKNQIIPVPISAASGFRSQFINAGEIQNKGIEVTLGGKPIQTKNFQWNLNVNFSKNQNKVIRLAPGVDSYVINDNARDITIEARPGEEFGALYGYGFERDSQGNIVVNNQGIPITDNSHLINFGSYQPDWRSGISTKVGYKNLTFSALVNIKHGGVMSSETYMWGRVGGTTKPTLKGREKPFVFQGGKWADAAVKQDGTPNDIPVDAEDYNQFFFGNAKTHIFDASYIKLSQLSLSYNFPNSLIKNFPQLKEIKISLIANNVWMIHKNVPLINPEVAFSSKTSVQGIESESAPHARSYGFNINLKF